MQSIVEQEQWSITNDQEAEWALRKISTAEAEANRLAYTCDLEIQRYTKAKQEAIARCERDTSYLRAHLERYFDTVPRKTTKTQETYRLPSGVLKRKYQTPSFEKDEDALLAWAKTHADQPYVKVKETANWDAIKKACLVTDSVLVDENEEVVPGVTVVNRPPVFSLEYKEGDSE